MNCVDARHRMLIADPAVLRGESDVELRDHLAHCERCAVDVSRIVERTAMLARAVVESRSPERRARRPMSLQRMAWVPIVAAAGFLAMAINHRGVTAPSFYADTLGVRGLITPIFEDSEPVSSAATRASDSSLLHRSSDSAKVQRGAATAAIVRYNRSLIRQVADLTSAPSYTLAAGRSSR
jgi:hypothetical protein